MGNTKISLERIDPNRWLIPQRHNSGMHVPGMVYADDELIQQIQEDNALQQVASVATLPGIVGYSIAMPDIHWGYGFPVGGVAATKDTTTPIEMSFFLAYGNEKDSQKRSAVAVNIHAFSIV